MLADVETCAVVGLDGVLVEVEADIGFGLPAFTIAGHNITFNDSPMWKNHHPSLQRLECKVFVLRVKIVNVASCPFLKTKSLRCTIDR